MGGFIRTDQELVEDAHFAAKDMIDND